MSDDDLLNDDEIQKLLAQAAGGGSPAASAGGAPDLSTSASDAAGDSDSQLLDSNELEALLAAGSSRAAPAPTGAMPSPPPASTFKATGGQSTSQRAEKLLDDVDAGLEAAMFDEPRGRRNVVSELEGAEPFDFAEFGDPGGPGGRGFSLGTLDDVELDLHIELGRAELLIDEVLLLREGAVVPLDKLAGDPVDILVNGRLLARGEVLVLNDNFCVRVAEIISPDF